MDQVKLGTQVTPCPMPVTLVGTKVGGRVNFMAVAWIARVNNKPPIWGAAIAKRHFTMEAIRESSEFSISFPTADMIEQTDYCGLGSGRKIDKSDVFDVFYGTLDGAPMIQGCPLSIECRLYDIVEMPTNNLVLGEVVGAYSEERYLTDSRLDITKANPVVLTMPDNRYWTIGQHLADAWSVGKSFRP
ncbi:flavin reductase family protein [Candidatus Thorarchaeota archaeon]|nr:MAG: flavin reductase family protein [Candidatus Thorarchaeota archaeon]